MMLRHSFQLETEAAKIEQAVERSLAAGHRTKDIARRGDTAITSAEMGDRVIAHLPD
jgi:3-isopropylmalate dehydrogenase